MTGFGLLGSGEIAGSRGAARTGGLECGGSAVFAVIRSVPECNSSGSVFPLVAGCEFVEGHSLAPDFFVFRRGIPAEFADWDEPADR